MMLSGLFTCEINVSLGELLLCFVQCAAMYLRKNKQTSTPIKYFNFLYLDTIPSPSCVNTLCTYEQVVNMRTNKYFVNIHENK